MDVGGDRARLDWLAEIAGAVSLAIAAGYAALMAAPSLGLPAAWATGAVGLASLGFGWLAIRAVKAPPEEFDLARFDLPPLPADEPLLLEDLAEVDQALLLEDVFEEGGALLLDDPIEMADPASRVVRLFASLEMPSAGELKQRIDRHLANADRLAPVGPPMGEADASDALFAALAELKRSLR